MNNNTTGLNVNKRIRITLFVFSSLIIFLLILYLGRAIISRSGYFVRNAIKEPTSTSILLFTIRSTFAEDQLIVDIINDEYKSPSVGARDRCIAAAYEKLSDLELSDTLRDNLEDLIAYARCNDPSETVREGAGSRMYNCDGSPKNP